MQIRDEQMAVLAKASEERFIGRLEALVAGRDPKPQAHPDMRSKCRQAWQRARAAGLTTEFEVAAFVLCSFHFGEDFDSQTGLPFYRILQDSGAKPRIKAAQMIRVLEESEKRMREAARAATAAQARRGIAT